MQNEYAFSLLSYNCCFLHYFAFLLLESDSDDEYLNCSQAAPKNAEVEILESAASSSSSITKDPPKRLTAKEKAEKKRKEDEEDAENDIFDASQQSYYCLPVNSHLIMEFEEKTYLVVVEKVYPLSVEVRVRFYEAWDNGDPLTTHFKFEEGTRAHARIPARFMC